MPKAPGSTHNRSPNAARDCSPCLGETGRHSISGRGRWSRAISKRGYPGRDHVKAWRRSTLITTPSLTSFLDAPLLDSAVVVGGGPERVARSGAQCLGHFHRHSGRPTESRSGGAGAAQGPRRDTYRGACERGALVGYGKSVTNTSHASLPADASTLAGRRGHLATTALDDHDSRIQQPLQSIAHWRS